ncbi:hypothetical protein OHA72_45000 [Dactylosporangium sp. NBC_01737]|uniref:tetratricopeptide repeat protein n=1 Tax=Dactylosporangium sp. NBC_01737 TaxID=2975959 RepID=UPI002E0FE8C8|nr:hypothetical protein OHA72_45000 [Dactylosporangium sp. NBC_01737]
MNGLPGLPAAGDADAAMSLEQLLGRASVLLDAGRHEAAAALVGAALRMAPDSADALALSARCLLLAGDPEHALRAAREAARRSDSELVRSVLAASVGAVCADRLEKVRGALRGRDLDAARELLRGIAALGCGDRFLVLVSAYTAGRPPLAAEQREEVLSWLLREELDEAAALKDEDHGRSLAAAERALAIDGRSMLAALLGAEAILRAVVSSPARSGVALRSVLKDLRHARDLLQRHDESEEFRRRADPLRTPINQLARHVAGELRVQLANELKDRYNAIVSTYAGRVISVFEASNARRSLAPLSQDVTKLRRQCPPDSTEAVVLTQLARAIASLQQQLHHY